MYTGWVGMELLDGRTLLPSILKAIGLTPSLEEGNLSPEERGEVGDIRGGEVRERESYSCVWWYTSVIAAFGRLKKEEHHGFDAYLDPLSTPSTLTVHKHSPACGACFLLSQS